MTIPTRGGCYTIDEKMGQTYIHEDMANTLAQRDYKQPQTVIVFRDDITIKVDGGAKPSPLEQEITRGYSA